MGGTLTICAQDLTVRNRRTFNAMNYFNEKWSWSREPDRERIAVGTCSCAGAGASTSTGILRPGEIALMTVRHGGGDPYYVRESLMPFFEEIQDFEHLIIDMREHSGGGRFHFMESKMRPLISEPIYINYVKFFTGEGYASWMIENNLHFRNQLQSTEVRVHNAAEFVAERGMMYFNQDDLQYLVYAVELIERLEPMEDSFPFNGRIWMLTSRRTASAGEAAVLQAISSGFATTVGQPTRGIMSTDRNVILLPNTMIRLTVDVGYLTDGQGRSLQAFGIEPHYHNHPNMNALQTTLAMIDELGAD